jgi:hypothetical protein
MEGLEVERLLPDMGAGGKSGDEVIDGGGGGESHDGRVWWW